MGFHTNMLNLIFTSYSSKHKFQFSMLRPRKNESLRIQLYSVSPPPRRDYYGVKITASHVTLNIWRISHGPYVYPKVKKCTLKEYANDYYLQCDIGVIFGKHVHQYILDLETAPMNLQFLPTDTMLRILDMLSNNDILRLSQTSKIFWELCNTNATWRVIFCKRNKYAANKHEIEKAQAFGWKSVLQKKIQNKIITSLSKSMKSPITRPFNVDKIDQIEITPLPKSKVSRVISTSSQGDIANTWVLQKDQITAYKNIILPKNPFEQNSVKAVRKTLQQTRSTSTLPEKEKLRASLKSKSSAHVSVSEQASFVSKLTK